MIKKFYVARDGDAGVNELCRTNNSKRGSLIL